MSATDGESHGGGKHHHLRTPTSELPHDQKLARQQLHLTMLSIVLLVTVLLLAYSAAFDLDSWAEWLVFGAIVSSAIGAGIMVNTHGRA